MKAVPEESLTLFSRSVVPWLSQPSPVPVILSTRGHIKPLPLLRAQCHPGKLPKPPGGRDLPAAARGALQFPRHGYGSRHVEQCLGSPGHPRPPAAAPTRYLRAPLLALNIHLGLSGSAQWFPSPLQQHKQVKLSAYVNQCRAGA